MISGTSSHTCKDTSEILCVFFGITRHFVLLGLLLNFIFHMKNQRGAGEEMPPPV